MERLYLTYTRLKIGNSNIDPQDNMNIRWGKVFNFRETWAMGEKTGDPRIIAVIDYDEDKKYLVDAAIEKDGIFEFTVKDKEWVIEHMNEWVGKDLWSFDDNNVFLDLRPMEDI